MSHYFALQQGSFISQPWLQTVMLVLTSNYTEDPLKAMDKSQLIDIAISKQNQIEESWKKLAK